MKANLAVVARRNEPADSLDYFPTPPWATRAFVEHVLRPNFWDARGQVVWEPACGEGHMAVVLAEYFDTVIATDVFPYGFGLVDDFLDDRCNVGPVDWVITNPPFKTADQFIKLALARARAGVAVLVRTSFLEGADRYANIFKYCPPTLVAQYCERVPMWKGRWNPVGGTATSYCWLVWHKNCDPKPFHWIEPGCRKRLTHPMDIRRFCSMADAPLLDVQP